MSVSTGRPRPGPGAPLTAERESYLRLVAQGMSNVQACREVGVHPTTGRRWRDGRKMVDSGGRARYYPPIAAPPVVISARFLSEDERVLIGDLLRTGQSIRSIAVRLGRSPSTISREVRRNATDVGNYRPFTAHRMALTRRPRPRPGKLAHDKPLRDFVQGKLKLHWSPEQICHALPSEFPGQRERHLVHETIYQALYVQGRGELRRELTRALRTGRARRKPHRRPDARRQGCIVDPTVMISQRPAEAEDRAIPGHWEGDLIMGEGNRSAIGTLVERSTRYVMLLHLPAEHTRSGPRCADQHGPDPARPFAPVVDLGPGQGNGPTPTIQHHHRRPGVLLRPTQPLATRIQREHQRVAPSVLSEEHRPDRPHPGGPARGGRRVECTATENPELGHPGRAPQHDASHRRLALPRAMSDATMPVDDKALAGRDFQLSSQGNPLGFLPKNVPLGLRRRAIIPPS